MKSTALSAENYNQKLAEHLKESGDFEAPAWIVYVKSGAGKVRPIMEPDFWHRRAASILRQISLRGIVGVERLRTRYGNRKNKGMKPAQFYRGGGKIIRTILQQAETAGLIEKAKGTKAGRQLTAEGKKLLENIK